MELKNNLFKLVITPVLIIIFLVTILSDNFFFDFNTNLVSKSKLDKSTYNVHFLEKYTKENLYLINSIKNKNNKDYLNYITKVNTSIPNDFKKTIKKIRKNNLDNKIDLKGLIDFNKEIQKSIYLNYFLNIRNTKIQEIVHKYETNIKMLGYLDNIYLLYHLGNNDSFLIYSHYLEMLEDLNKQYNLTEYNEILKLFKSSVNNYTQYEYFKNTYLKTLTDIFNLNTKYHQQIDKLLLENVHYIQQMGFIFFFGISIFIVISFSLYNNITKRLLEEDEISTLRKNIINNDIIYSETDLRGIITYTSNYFEKISGYTKEELIGQPHNIIRHPDMPKEIFKEIWETIQSGKKWEGIIKNRSKNGQTYYVSSSIFPIYKNGEHIGYASSREDVTNLILEEKKSSKIYDALNTIVITTNGENIINFNNKFYDYFNFDSFEDFVSQHDCICELFIKVEGKDFLTPDYKGMRWVEYLYTHQNSEEIFKVCMEDKYFNKKVFRVKLVPDIVDSGQFVIIFIDITNIENQSDMLLQQAKFSTMGEMVGMIAHQWRQPLSTLNGMFLPLLLKQQMGVNIPYEELKERVDKQKEIVVYLSDTIEDFLNFTRVDDNYDVDIIENTIFKPYRLVENSYKDLNINFNVYYENCTKIELIKTKHNKFNQILLNLYKNSIDEFKKKKIENPTITVEVQDFGDKLEYIVSDNAGGIPEEIIGKIFNPYFSTKSKNGTGIGLYMSKVIAQNHLNGSINVYNNDKGGVSFLIYIKKN
jgi:PAS domain S-box-containing protein